MNQITIHGKTYKLPKNPVWRSGPPPSIGWWPACAYPAIFDVECLRFFDGVAWSIMCHPEENARDAGRQAKQQPGLWEISEVKWTDQWWK